MDKNQQYRFNFKLRRRGQAALDHNRCELRSEDYDDDRAYCKALADEAYEMLQADREYLAQKSEGMSDEDQD